MYEIQKKRTKWGKLSDFTIFMKVTKKKSKCNNMQTFCNNLFSIEKLKTCLNKQILMSGMNF